MGHIPSGDVPAAGAPAIDSATRDASFIAGDWGTTHLRLSLCDSSGTALDSLRGPGVAGIEGRFREVLESLTSPWRRRYGPLPTVMCGMVGSTIGWTDAPYVACPAQPQLIADACVVLQDYPVHITPGLSCRNHFGAPDFMRGEETQILGAMSLDNSLGRSRRLLCLPGTHTKWAVLEDGWIREFLTAPTGEVFALLREHSVLVRYPGGTDEHIDVPAFEEGLARFNEYPDAQLLHRLFECRARQLSGALTARAARDYLSGLLVASDVHGALRALSAAGNSEPVWVIGSPELTRLYASALAANRRAAHYVDGEAASLAGLVLVRRRLSQSMVTRAPGVARTPGVARAPAAGQTPSVPRKPESGS
jgi:2-dehydro-3-deoxygalactonokinase